MKQGSLGRLGTLYVWAVVLAGAAPLMWSVRELASGTLTWHWLVLASLTLFSGRFSIRLSSISASVSASEAFIFSSALLFGPAPATLTVAIDGLIVSLSSKQRSLTRTLFNVAEPAISVWVAAWIYYELSGTAPLFQQPVALTQVLLPLLALTAAYFTLNTAFTTTAVYCEAGRLPAGFVKRYGPHLGLNFFASFSLGVLLVLNADNISFAAVGVMVPLLVMSYFSSKTSMARFEDANRHLGELNKLYLSTVETLAMAIDAKDQITHGHLRRVQVHAVSLAQALGVKDPLEIKALEAAALLHDLGKLAVPEHILNKPGALTPTEFEVMKSHATIGANILARIEFPYPVTPIVRHHHESWDGSGYPDGLSGEAIPLAARILSVVDCFDALTSDRPYRRQLSDHDALEILKSRRGNNYDPRVVDTFIAIYETLPKVTDAFQKELADLVAPPVPIRQSTRPAMREQLATRRGDRAPAQPSLTLEAVTQTLQNPLQAFGPDVFCTVFKYEPETDELVASFVSSAQHQFIVGLRMPMGERLTGWVAANRGTIVNSDPTLDLGSLAEQVKPRLQKCMATPLLAGDALMGVCTLYSNDPRGFSEDHAVLLERIASDVVSRLEAAPAPVAVLAHSRPRMAKHGSGSTPAAVVGRRPSSGSWPAHARLIK